MRSIIIVIKSIKEGFLIDKLKESKYLSRIIVMSSNAFHEMKNSLQKNLICDLMIIDEGHKAKNVETCLRIAIKEFQVNKQKIILTGTPIQNNLQELFSLLDIVQNGILGTIS
jgi:SNF2 family DNA or RNA helicase